MRNMYHSIQILLVEDNEGDVVLIKKAFSDARLANKINVCRDGQEGYEFLKKIGRLMMIRKKIEEEFWKRKKKKK